MGVDDRPGRSDNRESHLLGTERIQRAARMGGGYLSDAAFFIWYGQCRRGCIPFRPVPTPVRTAT